MSKERDATWRTRLRAYLHWGLTHGWARPYGKGAVIEPLTRRQPKAEEADIEEDPVKTSVPAGDEEGKALSVVQTRPARQDRRPGLAGRGLQALRRSLVRRRAPGESDPRARLRDPAGDRREFRSRKAGRKR